MAKDHFLTPSDPPKGLERSTIPQQGIQSTDQTSLKADREVWGRGGHLNSLKLIPTYQNSLELTRTSSKILEPEKITLSAKLAGMLGGREQLDQRIH